MLTTVCESRETAGKTSLPFSSPHSDDLCFLIFNHTPFSVPKTLSYHNTFLEMKSLEQNKEFNIKRKKQIFQEIILHLYYLLLQFLTEKKNQLRKIYIYVSVSQFVKITIIAFHMQYTFFTMMKDIKRRS